MAEKVKLSDHYGDMDIVGQIQLVADRFPKQQ